MLDFVSSVPACVWTLEKFADNKVAHHVPLGRASPVVPCSCRGVHRSNGVWQKQSLDHSSGCLLAHTAHRGCSSSLRGERGVRPLPIPVPPQSDRAEGAGAEVSRAVILIGTLFSLSRKPAQPDYTLPLSPHSHTLCLSRSLSHTHSHVIH